MRFLGKAAALGSATISPRICAQAPAFGALDCIGSYLEKGMYVTETQYSSAGEKALRCMFASLPALSGKADGDANFDSFSWL